MLSPLPGGEGKGEGEPKTLFSVVFFHKGSPSPRPSPPRRGRIIVRSFCESDTFMKARPTIGDGERDVRITKQTSKCYSLSLAETGRVRASQKLYSPLSFSIKVRPHPGPLPPRPPRRGRIVVSLFCGSDTFVKARPTVGDGEERRQNYQTNVRMLFPL